MIITAEYHLYFNEDEFLKVMQHERVIFTYDAISNAIEMCENIHTNQIITCKLYLIIEHGYRIFIHPIVGDMFEVTLGDCAGTSRELRPGHSLPNMLISGAFDEAHVTN